MLDNGAYTLWQAALRAGRASTQQDWRGYYEWVEPWLDFQTTWAVIPDVIDGDPAANDRLIAEWPYGQRGAPVWHMHEPVERLLALADAWPRVAIGISGAYSYPGNQRWHTRMREAMNALCGDGPAPVWLHMLRGMRLAGGPYPFASADSVGLARNHAGDKTRGTPPKSLVAMAERVGGRNTPGRWRRTAEQEPMAL